MVTAGHRSREEWQELDRQHYLHPFTDHKELAEHKSRIITRADGIYIYDADGNEILDGMSGLWCVNVGYGRNELVIAAEKQLRELPYYNSFFQCAHPPSIELSKILDELTQPQFSRVFYTGSGSESIDTMLRIVWRYWDLMDQPDRKIVIARKNAYHGSTVAGASLGGMEPMHKQGGVLPYIEHIDQPYWFGSDRSMTPHEFGVYAAGLLEKKIEALGADKVAAFVGEPIQGAGGVIIPPESYWPEIQRVCDHYGILLVTDEVICGFGRLGEWFGADYYGVKPDLMTFAKAVTSGYLPLGGVMVSDMVGDVLIDKGGEFYHGYTYSGHPACCAAALKNIEILKRDKILEHVREIEPYFFEKLNTLYELPIVGDIRGKGLMAGIECVINKKSKEALTLDKAIGSRIDEESIKLGLIIRPLYHICVLSPALIINKEQINDLTEKLYQAISNTIDQLKNEGLWSENK